MTHERNASASSSISRPQKCIIFLENMGEPSSIWLRINKEKGKILASNTTSGTCALYNFQPCICEKNIMNTQLQYIQYLYFNTKYRIVWFRSNFMVKLVGKSCNNIFLLKFYVPPALSACLHVCLSTCLFCLYVLSVHLSVFLSASLLACLHDCLSALCLFVCYVCLINTAGWYCLNLSV